MDIAIMKEELEDKVLTFLMQNEISRLPKEVWGILRENNFVFKNLADKSGCWFEKDFLFDEVKFTIVADYPSLYLQTTVLGTTVHLYSRVLTEESLMKTLQSWNQI